MSDIDVRPTDNRPIVKNVTTASPAGIRIGRSNDSLILEFLDDRESHLEVIFSGAINREILEDLVEKFQSHLASDNEK